MQNYRTKGLKYIYLTVIVIASLASSCKQQTQATHQENGHENVSTNDTELTAYQKAVKDPLVEFRGTTVDTRFLEPEGYIRLEIEEDGFGNFLRKLPLKVPGSLVTYFDGRSKPNNQTYVAVVDMDIGNKDLHQCADAIMRLRAEYLWFLQRYEQIQFDFTNGHRVAYAEWMKGNRISIAGNKTSWTQSEAPSNSYSNLWAYLETIFMYAGTLSLSKELESVPLAQMEIGDIFIQGGSPGHAVIVVDMAESRAGGEKIFMLAQSYMPAQELQILENRQSKISPWYSLEEGKEIITPEWTFSPDQLKRFR